MMIHPPEKNNRPKTYKSGRIDGNNVGNLR